MEGSERTLLQKTFFFVCTALIGANLIVVALDLASPNNHQIFGSVSNTFKTYASALNQTASQSVHVVSQFISNTNRFVASITNIHTLIKPATATPLQIIQVDYYKPAADTAPPANTPAAPAPTAVVAAAPVQSPAPVQAPALQVSTANLYAWGNCTWWVAIRRAQVSDPIPNTWGNAATWAERAAYGGYVVNHTPSPGAIMQIAGVANGLGHVAFVESVDPDGTWHISEMNVLGLDRVDYQARPASAAAYYYFIHDKT